MKRYQTD